MSINQQPTQQSVKILLPAPVGAASKFFKRLTSQGTFRDSSRHHWLPLVLVLNSNCQIRVLPDPGYEIN